MANPRSIAESLPLPANVSLLSNRMQSVLVKAVGARLFFQGDPIGDGHWNPVHLRSTSRPLRARISDTHFAAYPAVGQNPARIEFENSEPHRLRPYRLYRIDDVNKQVLSLKPLEERGVVLRQLLANDGFTNINLSLERQHFVERGRTNEKDTVWVTDGTVTLGHWEANGIGRKAELLVGSDATFLLLGNSDELSTAWLHSAYVTIEQVLPFLSEYKGCRKSIAQAQITHGSY